MKWIAAVTLIALTAGCNESTGSHREYIITQSKLEKDHGKVFIDVEER